MGAHILADPFAGLSDAKVAQIIRDYGNLTLTVDEVMRRNRIGSARLKAILDVKKVKPRGARPFGDKKRTMSQVFLGMQPPPKITDDAIERAKTALRRRGCIVYDAEISDGAKGRGLIRVDQRRMTRAEVLRAARGPG